MSSSAIGAVIGRRSGAALGGRRRGGREQPRGAVEHVALEAACGVESARPIAIADRAARRRASRTASAQRAAWAA